MYPSIIKEKELSDIQKQLKKKNITKIEVAIASPNVGGRGEARTKEPFKSHFLQLQNPFI